MDPPWPQDDHQTKVTIMMIDHVEKEPKRKGDSNPPVSQTLNGKEPKLAEEEDKGRRVCSK